VELSSRLLGSLENPSTYHWNEAKRVFRYLNGTRDLGILICGLNENGQNELIAYSDSDFADSKDYKSTSGCVILLLQ
jgi:hypothetical protein